MRLERASASVVTSTMSEPEQELLHPSRVSQGNCCYTTQERATIAVVTYDKSVNIIKENEDVQY